MRLLHNEEERIILQLADGTIVTLFDRYMEMKHIAGRRKTERKRMEYTDLLEVNDALKKVYDSPWVPQ